MVTGTKQDVVTNRWSPCILTDIIKRGGQILYQWKHQEKLNKNGWSYLLIAKRGPKALVYQTGATSGVSISVLINIAKKTKPEEERTISGARDSFCPTESPSTGNPFNIMLIFQSSKRFLRLLEQSVVRRSFSPDSESEKVDQIGRLMLESKSEKDAKNKLINVMNQVLWR